MSTKYQMQARSSVDGTLKTWLRAAPDWTGALFPGPGSPLDVAIACATLVAPTGLITATINAQVPLLSAGFVGSVGSGTFLKGLPEYLSWMRVDYLAELTRKKFAANILG